VRAAVAGALGRLGKGAGASADAVAAALDAAANDRDEDVRAAAKAAKGGKAGALPARDEWRVFYVVDPSTDDKPVREEPYFLIGGDGLVWATYTDARGQVVSEHFPGGDAVVAPQSRESEY
jgi:hypothetical protein